MLVEAQLSQKILESPDFSHFDCVFILENQMKSLLNMVPNDLEYYAKTSERKMSFDPFQPLEVLQGQCFADFTIHDVQVLSHLDQNLDSPDATKQSLAADFLSFPENDALKNSLQSH